MRHESAVQGERAKWQTSLDPFDTDFIACPFPSYDSLRESGGVSYVDRAKGFWLVTRHDLVKQVVGDPKRFSSESGPLGTNLPSPELRARLREVAPAGRRGDVPTLLTLDPPAHTRNRRLISRAFTPASVRRYEELTRGICRSLIDTITAKARDGRPVDFVADFAVPLPVSVIAHALDVPHDQVEDFKRWSDASVAAIGSDLSDDEIVEDMIEMLELEDFVAEQIERKRRAGPAPDIMSQLVHAELTEDDTAELGGASRRVLNDQEIQSIVRQLIVAGNETTTNLLTQLMLAFSHDPVWWSRMGDDPQLIPAVVEEGLRMASPSAVNQRITRCPVELGDVTIPEGDIVLVCYLAADHDPSVFPDPERFDPRRPNLGEHLAFGRGIHFCPGASLARMETRIAMEELVAGIESFELSSPEPLQWNRSFQLRAVRALPVSFHPRP